MAGNCCSRAPKRTTITTRRTIMFVATVTTAAHVMGRRFGAHAFRAGAAMPPPSRLMIHNRGIFSGLLPPSSLVINHQQSFYSSSSSLITTRIKAQQQNSDENDNNNNNDNFEPTWTYTPYQPPPARKPSRTNNTRRFSSQPEWTVPTHISIPEDQLQISFSRASGAGGQNVNKVNTKVELRFHVPSASWIPKEVRDRLQTNEANRINSEGYMVVTSQEHRTQVKNRQDALNKLKEIVKNSWARPKVRKMRKGLTKKAKENRRENKKKVSLKKESRRRVEF